MKLQDVSVQEVSKSVRVLTDFSTREVRVQQAKHHDWETVMSYNYMSDDYAFSNARISAQGIARRIGEI